MSASTLIPSHIQRLVGSSLKLGGDGPLDPLKPASDERTYRAMQLPNGLTVTLISDPKADRAAAALVVGAGHLSDPRDMAGCHHAVEHFCFQGSAVYPPENHYKKVVKEAGGATNASTSSEAITYHFNVNHDRLAEVLDVWAQFFIGPLFLEETVERELNAITNEDARNRTEDGRRYYQLLKDTCAREHVFSKFGTGNIGTLLKSEANGGLAATRQAVMELHRRYYRAPLMSLAVIGREPVDELARMVTGQGARKTCDFNLVPTLEGFTLAQPQQPPRVPLHFAPVDKSRGHPYPGHLLGRVYWLTPIKEQRTLTLRFPLVDFPMVEFPATLNLLAYVLGYEGQGSLLALLKRLGWADALSAGSDKLRHFCAFEVDLRLTKRGLDNAHHVVALVFRYLQLMRAGTVNAEAVEHLRAIHGERASLAASNVRFAATVPPLSAALAAASATQVYPTPLAIVGGSLPSEFDLDAFRAALATLHPRNLHLTVQVRDASLGIPPVPATATELGVETPSVAVANPSIAQAASVIATTAATGTKPPPAHVPPVDSMISISQQQSQQSTPLPTTATSAAAPYAGAFPLSEDAYRAHVSSPSAVSRATERYYGFDYSFAGIRDDHMALWGGSGGASTAADAFTSGLTAGSASSPFHDLLSQHLARDKWHLGPLAFETSADEYVAGLVREQEGGDAGAKVEALTLPPLNPFIATDFALADPSVAAAVEAKARNGPTGPCAAWEDITAASAATPAVAPSTGPASTARTEKIVLPPSPFDFLTADDAMFKAAAALLEGSPLSADGESKGDGDAPEWSKPLSFEAKYPKALRLPLPAGLSHTNTSTISKTEASSFLPSPTGVFIKHDDTFKLPKTFVAFRFSFPSQLSPSSSSPGVALPGRNDYPFVANWERVYLAGMLEDRLNEALKYQASSAGLASSVSFESGRNVLSVTVRGYSQKVPVLLKATVDFLTRDFLDESKYPREAVMRPLFNRLRDLWRKSISNRSRAQPHVRCDALLDTYLNSHKATDEEELAMTDAVTMEQVLGFWREAVVGGGGKEGGLQLRQAILYGNVDVSSDPQALIDVTKPLLLGAGVSSSAAASPSYAHLFQAATAKASELLTSGQLSGRERGILLRAGTDVTVTERHPSPFEKNCAVVMSFQLGLSSPRNSALRRLLQQVIAEPFATQLRTQEQLGYIVRSVTGHSGTVPLLQLEVQSANSSAGYIEGRMVEFVENRFLGKEGILAQLSEEKLRSMAEILASQALEPDKTQLDAFRRVCGPVTDESFEHHFAEAYAAALRALTKQDIVNFAEATLRSTSPYLRRITCRVIAPEAESAAPVAAAPALAQPSSSQSPAPASSAAGTTNGVTNGGGPAVWPDTAKELQLSRKEFLASKVVPRAFDEGSGKKLDLASFAAAREAVGATSADDGWIGAWAPTMAEIIAMERRGAAQQA